MTTNSRSKAWMLGPKAENAEVFEKMLLEAFRDYCYWRRNFHPEDDAWITAEERLGAEFQGCVQDLRDHLFAMLSDLKRSIPSFSPRYLGHMISDMLMPGVLGYMAAMLYNQNNITQEASTITLEFEMEAMQLVARMLGFPEQSAWGHLCSGGTVANMEALWVARNARLVPYQIALAIECDDVPAGVSATLAEMPLPDGRPFGEMLANKKIHRLHIPDIIAIHEALTRLCSENADVAEHVQRKSVGHLGLAGFSEACRARLRGSYPTRFRILVSRNAHYSVRKSLGIVGLGEGNIIPLPLDRRMRMDMDSLAAALDECGKKNECVMAVVGAYGSTEEGAIDDFSKIDSIRRDFRESGQGDFWLHGDACYGGYALAMMHPHTDAAGLAAYMRGLLPDDVNFESVWDEKTCADWLRVSSALSTCDSIAIDPHKLGYIPYPAGSVVYRDFRIRELIRCDAPYINAVAASEDSAWHTAFLGKYTLEGSRPGAYGAAVWLAHKTVPLDRSGHGAIVAQSINGARYLQETLQQELRLDGTEDGIGSCFLCHDPDLNIMCYTFPSRYEGEIVSLAVLNRSVEQLYNECLPTEDNPTQTRDFVMAMTSLDVEQYGERLQHILAELPIRGQLVESGRPSNPWRDDGRISVVRTVVMGPFLVDIGTRHRMRDERVPLVREYAEFLRQSMSRIIGSVLDSPIPTEMRPALPGNVLVLHEDAGTLHELCDQLNHVNFRGEGKVLGARDIQTGLELVERNAIGAALVDIDLGPDHSEDGIQFLETMISREHFRGSVVFTTHDEVRDRVTAVAGQRGDWSVKFRRKPSRLHERFQAACNGVMEDLWDVLWR